MPTILHVSAGVVTLGPLNSLQLQQRKRKSEGMLYACRVDESHLTGESDDVLKHADLSPVMLSGSKILEGYGRMLVTGVGENSAQGRILSSLTQSPADEEGGLRWLLYL